MTDMPMRVLLLGDHPWAGSTATVIRRCDPPPDGSCQAYIVELENGIMCHTYPGQWEELEGGDDDGA